MVLGGGGERSNGEFLINLAISLEQGKFFNLQSLDFPSPSSIQ